MNTQDPFARRQPTQNLGEVSSLPNNSEQEAKRISPFIPEAADIEEGYNKMLAILNQQQVDDARDGHAVTTDKVAMPTTPITSKQVTSSVFTNKAPEVTTEAPKVQPLLTEMPKEPEPKKEEKEEEVKITDQDVLPILDSILLRGYASETFSIRGNNVTIRTQFYWEEYAVRAAVESKLTDNSLHLTADNLLQKYILASCLESFGDNHFKPISQGTPAQLAESLEARVNFLNTLPTILVYYLNDKRIEFNEKLLYLSNNFDKLIKTF